MRKLSENLANKIYTILVDDCGARENDRLSFVHHFSETEDPTREWRFQGNMGFGGKFWYTDTFYLSCYREDETPEINKRISEVNFKLKVLYKIYVKGINGLKMHRHESNPDEKVFHDTFIADHTDHNDLCYIVFGQNIDNSPADYLTDKEDKIVISTIQWLGSPVGQSFLARCGFVKKNKN